MATRKIKKKALTDREFKVVKGKHPLIDLTLATGARIAEIKRIIDVWKPYDDYIDIKTKKSGDFKNRIFLNKTAQECIQKLEYFKGKNVKTLSNKYKSLSEEIGIKFTAHNLRATFATQLYTLGVPLVTISTLMNHSSLEMTAQYIHFAEGKLRGATAILEEYETFEGMTFYELQAEYVKIRERLKRLEEKNE